MQNPSELLSILQRGGRAFGQEKEKEKEKRRGICRRRRKKPQFPGHDNSNDNSNGDESNQIMNMVYQEPSYPKPEDTMQKPEKNPDDDDIAEMEKAKDTAGMHPDQTIV
ncbi:hypothetical protein NHQ30_008408 [Ciborinia camelliae]|nr:hypothetical protein NHQ30_008408 [Ciborinia camelliae]